jgi:hypothetical protein
MVCLVLNCCHPAAEAERIVVRECLRLCPSRKSQTNAEIYSPPFRIAIVPFIIVAETTKYHHIIVPAVVSAVLKRKELSCLF